MKPTQIIAGLVLSAALVSPTATKAETYFTCGASEGYAFYPPGGLVPEGEVGWHEDAISGGGISLVTLEDGSSDIIFSDTTGSYSSRGDGGKVIATYITEDVAQVTAIYEETGVIETYNFMPTQKLVMWTQSKVGTPILKIAAFTAPCS
jgi:hypothetical protein